MSPLKTLVAEVLVCETTTQLSTIVQQMTKCILQELLAMDECEECPEVVLEALAAIVKKSLPQEVSNYRSVSSRALIVFDNVRQLLLRIDGHKRWLPKTVVTELLFMTSGHNRPSLEWSSQEIHQNERKIIESMLKITDTKTSQELLNERYNAFVIHSLVAKVRTNCGDSHHEWHQRAVNRVIFEWIVANITAFDPHLHDIFAPTIQLIDDHVIDNKISGLRCLHLIVRNCWPTLRTNGSDLLIFERLKTLLYNKEPELFEVLFDCVLDVMNRLEAFAEPSLDRPLTAVTRNDQIVTQVLSNIRMSSDVNYRVIHLRFLDKFFVAINAQALKHTVSYVDLLCDLLDGEPITGKTYRLLEVSVNSLNAYMICVWVAIPEFMAKCLLCLLKLSVNTADSDLSPELVSKLNQRIHDSIHIMRSADTTDAFKGLAKSLMKSAAKKRLNDSLINLFNV